MRKLTYQEVKDYIERFGYKLLSDEYVNNQTKLLVRCPLGHKYETIYASFRQGHRCPECANEHRNDNRKVTYEEVKAHIESFGYKLLSDEYKNNYTKLQLQCPEGHIVEMKYGDFQQGTRCRECYNEHRGECQKLTYEEVKKFIESFGYKLLSDEYVNNNTKLELECDKGHRYEVTFSGFKGSKNRNGSRCPICNISKGEQKIMDYLNKNNIKYIYDEPYFNDLIGVGGGLLRPDFIIEDRKIWIEYDGEFHYKKMYEDDYYEQLQIHDEIKNQYAKKNNWKLIRIPYWEFDNIEKILNKESKLI